MKKGSLGRVSPSGQPPPLNGVSSNGSGVMAEELAGSLLTELMSESFPDSSRQMTTFQQACLIQIVGPMCFEGLSEFEVSEELGISRLSVRGHLNDMRRQLQHERGRD